MEIKTEKQRERQRERDSICFTASFINLELCLVPGFHLGVFCMVIPGAMLTYIRLF